MREIVLDAKNWNTADDFYDALFESVGAPNWHGRNFNAVRDSIAIGRINKIEVPYILKVVNFGSTGVGARRIVGDFVDLINELRAAGCPVHITIEA